MTGFSRRDFMKYSAGSVAAAAMLAAARERAAAYAQSSGLKKFVQPLRGVGPGGIPVAAPDAFPAPVTGALHYTIDINQYQDTLHPSLGPTTLWGYNPAAALGGGVQPQRHLGGIIVAQKGTPVQLTFRNNLPATHIMPVDTTIMGVMGNQNNRVCTHLHGGAVPWISDGGPFAWWDPNGHKGVSFMNNSVLNPTAPINAAEFYYPNNQTARMMWYHDHAIGLTRLNAYAGIASAYILRDLFEANLRTYGLPDFVENGGREIPIVIQDKIFVDAGTISKLDPTWQGPRTTGSLWYPHVYEKARWKLNGKANLVSNPSVIPEMFGDTMLANGSVYPEATVEARRYRIRLLNACQARFLNLQLYVDDGSTDGITLLQKKMTPTNAKGPNFLVIGTEGGFLSSPTVVPSNVPFAAATMSGSLITAPGERWDMIIDFTGFAGKKVIMYNDAPAPFPGGMPVNDFFPGNAKNPINPSPGSGPNTRQIMRFKVVARTGAADAPLALPTDLSAGIDAPLVPWTTAPLPPPPGVPVRILTLNETFDATGRLIQMLGTDVPVPGAVGYERAYDSTPTETPAAGSTEVWQIVNLTADTHPIHFHLSNVQILSRQPFNTFNGVPNYSGAARGPEATELGWKETVRMHPGEVTSVIMKFDLPTVPFTVPPSPRTGGNEYVWHCHILEHEEHDMMRPLVVG